MNININTQPGTTANNKTSGWRTYHPVTDYNKCIGCGMCSHVCPENIIEMINSGNKKKPQTNYDYCKGCGICANECPVKAINMEIDNK